MSLVPESEDEVGSDAGEVDEIDLLDYEKDPWEDMQDFLYQQRLACKSHGILLAGKPGAGKMHLADKLANELGAVNVGLPQILSQCVQAYSMQVAFDNLEAQIDGERNKKPPEPVEPVPERTEGAYNDEGAASAAPAPAPEAEAEGWVGPDEEQIAAWMAEQKEVMKMWSTLDLKPQQCSGAKEFLEAGQLMMAGKVVEGDLLGRLLTARLRTEEVQFRGYVLDSLPPPLLPDLLLQPGLPKLDYVLVLELTDAEALARLASLQLEPVANQLFSLGDRTAGDHQPLVEHTDADGNAMLDAQGQPIMVNETPRPLEKWVQRPQDMPESTKKRMEEYSKMVKSDEWQAALEGLQPGALIKLDASLSPQRVLACAKQALAFETYPIVHPPVILQGAVYTGPPDEAPALKPLEDLLKILDPATGEELTHIGPRSLSGWGPFCPVAFTAAGAKAVGLLGPATLDCSRCVDGAPIPKFVAEYCGKVFLLSSQAALQVRS